jgi:Fe-S oxidoreductase
MLVKMAQDGEIEKNEKYRESLFFCLLCGRCETVCPAGLSTVAITQQSRSALYAQGGLPWFQRLVYRGVFKRRPVMASTLGLVGRLPGFSSGDGVPLRHMADVASLISSGISIPRLSRPFLSERIANRKDLETETGVKGTVGFFPGCSFEFFFAGVGEMTFNALRDLGYRVVYPAKLNCCGLAVKSGGDAETARSMARRNIELLSGFDHVVTGCATCGSTLKEYGEWFEGDDDWRERARLLSEKVEDFSEFAAGRMRRIDSGRSEKVTFHDPCHLRWRQGIQREPREILRSVAGVELVEMDCADACCGLGGAFGVKYREISLGMQKKKMESIARTGAQTVVTSCPGCMIQLLDGARRHSLQIEVKHISQYF